MLDYRIAQLLIFWFQPVEQFILVRIIVKSHIRRSCRLHANNWARQNCSKRASKMFDSMKQNVKTSIPVVLLLGQRHRLFPFPYLHVVLLAEPDLVASWIQNALKALLTEQNLEARWILEGPLKLIPDVKLPVAPSLLRWFPAPGEFQVSWAKSGRGIKRNLW